MRRIDSNQARIEGVVICENDHTLAAGVTAVVFTAGATYTAITDDRGAYYVEVEPGDYKVDFYFADRVEQVSGVMARAHHATRVDATIQCD